MTRRIFMETIDLTAEQLAIYQTAMEHASLPQDFEIRSFHFDHTVTEQHTVAYGRLQEASSEVFGVVYLPELSNQVYMAFTDEQPEWLAELVAGFGADSETNDALTRGHMSRLSDERFLQKGWFGTIILPPTLLFPEFPLSKDFDGDQYEFQILLLLTEAEWQQAEEEGLESLLDYLAGETRNLYSLSPYAPYLPLFPHELDDLAEELSAIDEMALDQIQAEPQPPVLPSTQAVDASSRRTHFALPTWLNRNKLLRWLKMKDESFVVGETILGTLMLIGGIVLTISLAIFSEIQTASFFPAMFAIAGVATLYGAYKEARRLSRHSSSR